LKIRKKTRRVVRKTLMRPWIMYGRQDYVFILSHMRSRSTLLSHILGSHPELCGYAEMHNSYIDHIDLLWLRHQLYERGEKSPVGRLALDKILHDSLILSPKVYDNVKVKKIFLLRDPAETVKSILNMGRKLQNVPWHMDQKQVFSYYNERLKTLVSYAKETMNPGFFIDSEDLVKHSGRVLKELSQWLGLKETLRENYATFKYTGVEKHGDPFANIKTGKIVKQKSDYSEIVLEEELLREAARNFETTRKLLHKYCITG